MAKSSEILPTSPFSKTDFKPIGNVTKPGVHQALRLPDGKVIVNFNDSTNYAVLVTIAKHINAEVVTVRGIWTFTPDEEKKDDTT